MCPGERLSETREWILCSHYLRFAQRPKPASPIQHTTAPFFARRLCGKKKRYSCGDFLIKIWFSRPKKLSRNWCKSKMNICSVIPAMVQRLFFDISKQRNHKYATPPPFTQFYVFLATAPTGVLTAGPPLKQISGKGVANLWKNEGVAPLRELL